MREKKAVVPGKGKRGSFSVANSDAASKLACLIGAPTLKYVDDEDMEALCDYIKYLVSEAADDAYKQGYSEALSYTTDVERLQSMPCSTGH